MSALDTLINDLCGWLRAPGNSKAKLARLTGLHRNILLGCERDGWNPTLDVLRKIEPHVAADRANQTARVGAATKASLSEMFEVVSEIRTDLRQIRLAVQSPDLGPVCSDGSR